MSKLKSLAVFVAFATTMCLGDGNDQPKFVQASPKFYVSTEQKSFVGALISCKTGGMQLASVTTEEEQYEIGNATQASSYYAPDGYWIGAAAAEQYSSNSWYWIDSGLRMIYTNWGNGQPSYSAGHANSYCARLGSFYKENQPYKWENVDCNLLLYFVCELPATK